MKKVISSPIFFIFLICLTYLPALGVFFSGDDWFHLRITQINNITEFSNFFKFAVSEQSGAFYRPIPTQFFFFSFQSIFGLNPFFYHLFVLFNFGFSLYLVWKLSGILFDKTASWLILIIYALSATHFTRVYFLSAFQEIAMVNFLLLALIYFLQDRKWLPLVFFTLALGSKETAVVFPGILALVLIYQGKFNIWKILPFAFIDALFLGAYLLSFGVKTEDSYWWDFSPKKAINTLGWYVLWSLGAPESLVDYVSSGLRIVPRFFSQFPFFSRAILITLLLLIIELLVIAFLNFSKIKKKEIALGGGFFIIALGPLIFLPWHKFTLELTLPLIGFAVVIAYIIRPANTLFRSVFIATFILVNMLTLVFSYQTNYVTGRAALSERVFEYIKLNYPEEPNKPFVFTNNTESSDEWGVSRQISQATSNSDLFKVLYRNRYQKVYFEDLDDVFPKEDESVWLDSLIFLK